jgi:SpoVK/Ycf46/Vps4 family AAA+-type ATPase
MDIRVIATTNAPKQDIEPALLRNGRLAQYIQVVPVLQDHATTILHRLLDRTDLTPNWPAAKVPNFGRNRRGGAVGFASEDTIEVKGKVLLADIFKIAKGEGWKPKKVKAKVDVTKVIPRRPRPYKDEDGAQFAMDKSRTRASAP